MEKGGMDLAHVVSQLLYCWELIASSLEGDERRWSLRFKRYGKDMEAQRIFANKMRSGKWLVLWS
jgi:hypothetical protein